jgi:hypothetical protein
MYSYTRDKNGTDDCFDIYQGNEILVTIPFWDDPDIPGEMEAAERKATLIVNALNAYRE